MIIPLWLRQAAVISGSTAVGGGLGYGIVCAFIPAINRHLSATAGVPGPEVDSAAGVLASVGHTIGQMMLVVLGAGTVLIIAILAGLAAGLFLSGRLKDHNEGDTIEI